MCTDIHIEREYRSERVNRCRYRVRGDVVQIQSKGARERVCTDIQRERE